MLLDDNNADAQSGLTLWSEEFSVDFGVLVLVVVVGQMFLGVGSGAGALCLDRRKLMWVSGARKMLAVGRRGRGTGELEIGGQSGLD